MSSSLWSHGLQHWSFPCPSLSLGVCWYSCPLSQWCYPSHPPSPSSPPALNISQHQGLFQWVSFFHLRWPNIGTSASASVFSMNIQGWFPLGLTDLISWLPKLFSRVFSSTTVWKHQFFGTQPSLWFSSHIHTWLLEKP